MQIRGSYQGSPNGRVRNRAHVAPRFTFRGARSRQACCHWPRVPDTRQGTCRSPAYYRRGHLYTVIIAEFMVAENCMSRPRPSIAVAKLIGEVLLSSSVRELEGSFWSYLRCPTTVSCLFSHVSSELMSQRDNDREQRSTFTEWRGDRICRSRVIFAEPYIR